MLDLSCQCGAVRIAIERRPDFIHECNCSLCRKTGARWGYFAPPQVAVTGPTRGYCRADRNDPNAEVHFCPACGASTHFVLTASAVARFGDSVTGVNMRLAAAGQLDGIELRYPDGRAWGGAGQFSYVRAPTTLGETTAA